MINKKFPNQGLQIFPSGTADRTGRRLGQTPMRKCVQCGAWNDTRKKAWSDSGEGLGAADSEGSRDVTSGCYHCGSLKWLHSKPKRQWPAADKIPARQYRRSRGRI